MSITTTNMSLTAWDLTSDYFNHSELVANWEAVDAHDHTTGKGVQIPAGGLANDAVTGNTIADNAVTAAKIAANSVDAAQIVDASILGTKIGALPGARVYNNAALTIPHDTETLLTFNTERFDSDALHDGSTNPGRITASLAGAYVITAHIAWTANATGNRRLSIFHSGSISIASTSTATISGVVVRQSVSTVFHLEAGEWVEAHAYQNSGGNLDITRTDGYTPEFAVQWLGA